MIMVITRKITAKNIRVIFKYVTPTLIEASEKAIEVPDQRIAVIKAESSPIILSLECGTKSDKYCSTTQLSSKISFDI